jgi:hypothetical protein
LALNPRDNNDLWTVLTNGAIYRRTASYRNQSGSVSGTWTRIDGTATRIAHDGVRPWVVNAAGEVFWRNDQGTGWNLAPGCGRDVAGNAARDEYVIAGCDGSVYKLVGSEAQKIGRPSFGAATRVSLSHKVSAIGVVDNTGKGYLNNLSSPIPGALVNDFAFGADGTLWAITVDNRPAVFNVQPEIPGGDSGAPAKNKFEPFPGSAFAIAGNSRGEPTISNEAQRIADIRLFYTN